jgi:hypothetical protein
MSTLKTTSGAQVAIDGELLLHQQLGVIAALGGANFDNEGHDLLLERDVRFVSGNR